MTRIRVLLLCSFLAFVSVARADDKEDVAAVMRAWIEGMSSHDIERVVALYFWSRMVHLVAYTLAWPWIRTVAFTGGFVAQAIFAWQIVVH